MKSEPKTPLQMRAENMIRDEELLATAPPGAAGPENVDPDAENEDLELERGDVSFFDLRVQDKQKP